MKPRQHRVKVATAALLMAVVPLFSMYFHGRLERSQTLFETALISVTAPGQETMHSIFATVVGWWKGYFYLVEVEEQNEHLRAELQKLMLIASRFRGLEEENRRLQEMLDFRKEHVELELQSARIIARETSPFFSVSRIRLDQGDAARVRVDMPVVTAAGIVGRIEKASGDYCDVMLFTDTRSRIDVEVPGKGISGMLVGLGDALPVLRFPYQKEQPTKGDLLISTGHDRLYPKGLVAGFVASETPRQVGTQLEVSVEPAVRFSSLQEVFVVLTQQLPFADDEAESGPEEKRP